jgi:hypothetical protein
VDIKRIAGLQNCRVAGREERKKRLMEGRIDGTRRLLTTN